MSHTVCTNVCNYDINLTVHRDEGDSNVSTDDHDDLDITTLMQSELPPCVTKCLLLSGYDEKDVIQAIDTTENEGNSFSTIEQTSMKGPERTLS